MKMISTKCPECGANLKLSDDNNQYFCQYCGAKILLTNKTEHTTVIRDEAEILRASTEAKRQEFEQKKYYKKVKTKRILLTIKILLPLLAILIIFLLINNSRKPPTDYPLVNSESYTKMAFNITPEDVLTRFLEADQHLEEYHINHTDWTIKSAENDITGKKRKVFNGEKDYLTIFYYDDGTTSHENITEDYDYTLFSFHIVTDQSGNIIFSEMTNPYKQYYFDNADTLKGYIMTTVRNMFFSLINGQSVEFTNTQFEKSSSTTDGPVKYWFDSLGFLFHGQYQMFIE